MCDANLERRLRFVLDVVHRLLREGRLSRAWLHDVLWQDRHRVLAGGDEEAGLRAGAAMIDRWLEQEEGWVGDLEAIGPAHGAGRIAVELLRNADRETWERVEGR